MPAPARVIAVLVSAVLAATVAGPAAAASEPGAGLIVVGDDAAAAAAIAALDGQVNVREAEELEPSEDLSTVTVAASDAAEALALLNADPRIEYAEPDHTVEAVAVTDPLWSQQVGLPASGIDDVWPTTTGVSTVVVAVVDTGIAAGHEDLVGASVAPGRNFVGTVSGGTDNVADDHGHGTSVAGIIAAQHNGVGLAGVCPGCTILPIKALDSTGMGTYSDLIESLDYAVAQGADIVNLSLAGKPQSDALKAAVDAADAKGVLVVAAAGNAGTDTPVYPAGYASTLSVAGASASGERASSSNYGQWVDVAAPWSNVAPTFSGTNTYNTGFAGTSSASPVVAGAAGLLASASSLRSSGLTRLLTATATPVPYVRTGRIDAAAALSVSGDVTAPTVSLGPVPDGWTRSTVALVATAADDAAVKEVRFSVDDTIAAVDATAPYEANLDALTDGTHSVAAIAVDTAGNTTTSPAGAVRSDKTAPVIAISSPAEGATVSGVITVDVAASDTSPVTASVALGPATIAADQSLPLRLPIDTTALADGVHTINVTTTDSAGNTASMARTFTVSNASATGGGGGGGGGGAAPAPAAEPTEDPAAEPTPEPTESTPHDDSGATVAADVEAGGTLSTDPDGAGPTSAAPLQVAVTSPVAGRVSITRDDSVGVPNGYAVVGLQATIQAPAASAQAPLELVFDVHSSALPDGRDDAALVLFRNGVAVPTCTASDGSANPDPCVASHQTNGDAISITVLTSRASTWALGVAAVACPAPVSAGFADIDGNSHETAIDCAVARAIVGGTGESSYAPRESVTRAQMASFIANTIISAGARLPAGEDAFTDDNASVHERAINRLANAGIVGGVTRRSFDPATPVTREQMATFLVRAHDYVADQALAAGRDAFDDDDGRAHEASINKAAAAGLASGVGAGEFGPTQRVRRDQLASFVVRLLDRLVAAGDTD